MFSKALYTSLFFALILSLGTSYGDVNNILVNPGFESSPTGNWAGRSCNFTRATTPVHSGSRSGRAYGRTQTWQGIQQSVLNKMNVGQTYAVSGWVRTNSPSAFMHLSLEKTDNGTTTWTWLATGTANNTGWTYVYGTYTYNPTGTVTALNFYVETDDRYGDLNDVYLDDANFFGQVYVPTPPDSNATGNVNLNVRHQVLDGFGASGAWYENYVTTYGSSHPEIYNILFRDLGLDIYRIRNAYNVDTDNGSAYISHTAQIIAAGEASLGHPIKVMNTSWSPPASLKSNGNTRQGTLAKDGSGHYRYTEFAQWWADSLTAWSNAGVNSYYLNMQNEPGYQNPLWDTCQLNPTEDSSYAGYEQAFAALCENLNSLPSRPILLAPEGQDTTSTPNYVNALNSTDKSNIYGYSHHLYDGDANNPDGMISKMTTLKGLVTGKPLLQTEFSRGGLIDQWANAMNLAKLMHNALTIEEASAYLYWELFWPAPSGLVSVSNTSYTINPIYYIFKHYSYFTDPNWQRVDANTNSSNLRISAFISPDNQQLSAIILNTSPNDINLSLSWTGFTIADGNVWRSTSTLNCVLLGSFNPAVPLSVPANSITTLALYSITPDTTPPAVPTGLVAITGNGQVSLDWNDNIETDLAGYNVYRSTTSGSGYAKLNTSLLTSSDYMDYTVTNGILYYYVVTAVDTNNNESDYSNEASSEFNCAVVQAGGAGLLADLDHNCYIDYQDMAIMALYWLNYDCSINNNCQGADFEPADGIVDFYDFSSFALQWMTCNDPQNPDCTPNW